MAGLGWFIKATRWGAALRGMSEDPAALQLLGIDAKALATAVLAVSGMLAGVAGILWAIRVGRISPFDGTLTGLKGIAVMAIAGLGSMGGAVVVGLGVGLVESFANYYQLGGIEPALPWIMLVAVLLLRPRGLFSRSPA
jgi:branched-chain amino acid transport system permease protein